MVDKKKLAASVEDRSEIGLTPIHCRAARGLLNWTQEDLANAAGLSRTMVRNFETGRSEPTRISLSAMQMAFLKNGVRFVFQVDEIDDVIVHGVALARRLSTGEPGGRWMNAMHSPARRSSHQDE